MVLSPTRRLVLRLRMEVSGPLAWAICGQFRNQHSTSFNDDVLGGGDGATKSGRFVNQCFANGFGLDHRIARFIRSVDIETPNRMFKYLPWSLRLVDNEQFRPNIVGCGCAPL